MTIAEYRPFGSNGRAGRLTRFVGNGAGLEHGLLELCLRRTAAAARYLYGEPRLLWLNGTPSSLLPAL